MYVSYDDSAVKAERRVYVAVPRSIARAWRSIERPATPDACPQIFIRMNYRSPKSGKLIERHLPPSMEAAAPEAVGSERPLPVPAPSLPVETATLAPSREEVPLVEEKEAEEEEEDEEAEARQWEFGGASEVSDDSSSWTSSEEETDEPIDRSALPAWLTKRGGGEESR